ncbi:uncharacterized protein LOC144438961 [Glandiceps talaboti]
MTSLEVPAARRERRRNTNTNRQSLSHKSLRLSGQFSAIGNCWLLELSNALFVDSRFYQWQNLGDKLGFSQEDMEECERLWLSRGANPVYELLSRWGKREGATFRVMREKLRELGRLDVLMLLEEAIKGEFQLEVKIWMGEEDVPQDVTVHSSQKSTMSQILQRFLKEHHLYEDDIVFISPNHADFQLDWSTKAVKLKGRELILATRDSPRLDKLQHLYGKDDDDGSASDTWSTSSGGSNTSSTTPQQTQVIVKHYFMFDHCNIGTLNANPRSNSPFPDEEFADDVRRGSSASLPPDSDTRFCSELHLDPDRIPDGQRSPRDARSPKRGVSTRSLPPDFNVASTWHPKPPPPLPEKKGNKNVDEPNHHNFKHNAANGENRLPLSEQLKLKIPPKHKADNIDAMYTRREFEVLQSPNANNAGNVQQESMYMPLIREPGNEVTKSDDVVGYSSSASLASNYSLLQAPFPDSGDDFDDTSCSTSVDSGPFQQSLISMCAEHPAWHPNIPSSISEIEKVAKTYRRQDGWYFIYPYRGSIVVTVTFQTILKHFKIFEDRNGKIYFDKEDCKFRTLEDLVEVYKFRDIPVKTSPTTETRLNSDPEAPPLPQRGSHIRLRREIPVDPHLGF